MISALLLVALAQTPCLDQMRQRPAQDGPTFATERECELWRAIVLLEHDLRTATIAVAHAQALADLRAAPVVVPIAPATPEASSPPPWVWLVVVVGVVAASAGFGVGFAVGDR